MKVWRGRRVPEYRHECATTRWVAYFDLLGMRNLVSSAGILSVFRAYQQAIETLARRDQVRCAWFSDSFLIFTSDDSVPSFVYIEPACRWFAFLLLLKGVPARGAITRGELYADERARVYIGPALVEAYECGENQDWIGFVLTPAAAQQLAALKLPVDEQRDYRRYAIPFKQPPESANDYAACVIGNWNRILPDRRNQSIELLEEMLGRQSDARVRRKYENTLEFLRTHEPPAAAAE